MKNLKIKSLFALLLLFVLVTTLVSCKSSSVVVPTKTEITSNTITKVVIRDTVFETKKDSTYYRAWLECKEGKVIINSIPKITKGKYLQPPKVIIKDNYITVDCEAEAQKLFARYKNTYTQTDLQKTITNTIAVERQLTFWQKLQIWCGRIFLFLILVIVITSFLRWRKII